MFKECLKYDIIPFIITDENKALYYNGLKNYEHEKGYLTGTCKLMQDDFTDIIRYFLEK